MVFDSIEKFESYFNAPIFGEIKTCIQSFTADSPIGNTDFGKFYAKVLSYETHPSPQIIESHRKEVDIQVLLSGSEKIKLFDSSQTHIKTAYQETIDCQFYNASGKEHTEITLVPGKFAVFFPQDIHQCQFPNVSPGVLKKLVMKIPIQLFNK